MSYLRDLFIKKPFLAWFVKNKSELSQESMVEKVFNYGDWQDYLNIEKEIGTDEVKNIFERLKNKPRTNLRPRTINYFNHYFAKYAP